MPLQYRRTKSEDIPLLVRMVVEHPILGKRFESALPELATALQATLNLDSVRHMTLEERTPDGRVHMLGAGSIGFVTEEFVAQVKSPPYFWIGPEVTMLTATGKTPFLADSDLRRANTVGGLNTITWMYVISWQEMLRFEVQKLAMDAYCENLSGFRLKQIIGQATLAEELHIALQSGGLLLSESGIPTLHPHRPLEEIVLKPHVFCMTLDLVKRYLGTWTSLMFMHQDPILGFSRAEQHLLEAALHGLTDEELASQRRLSLSALKKTWRSIYSRVESNGIGILPNALDDHEIGDRGKGKKHRLLTYVRNHPEELRPVSMKLLRQEQIRRMETPH